MDAATGAPRPTDPAIALDHATDTVTIYGLRYSLELFRRLGLGPIGPGYFLQLVERTDRGGAAVLTIESWTREQFRRDLLTELQQAAARTGHALALAEIISAMNQEGR